MTENTCTIMGDAIVEMEGENAMSEIEKLEKEVELFRQAIEDAKEALASAEQELSARLEYEYANQ